MSRPLLTACHADLPPGFAYSREDDEHLHFIASSADEPEVLVLSFTTRQRFVDSSCVIQPGEHPFVTRPTAVSYQHAAVVTTQSVVEAVNTGVLTPQPPLSAELMVRVWGRIGQPGTPIALLTATAGLARPQQRRAEAPDTRRLTPRFRLC